MFENTEITAGASIQESTRPAILRSRVTRRLLGSALVLAAPAMALILSRVSPEVLISIDYSIYLLLSFFGVVASLPFFVNGGNAAMNSELRPRSRR